MIFFTIIPSSAILTVYLTTLISYVIQELLWSIRGSYQTIWSLPLTNYKWNSAARPITVTTSQPIRLFINFMTFISSLTFTELWMVSIEHFQRCGMPAWNTYHSRHLVPSLYRAYISSNCWDHDIPDFSPQISLCTLSILRLTNIY